jgi:glycine betaine/choline ABC-type transport system substrate-binding protein
MVAGCASVPPPPPALAVGTTADAESTLLANLYAAALRFYGTPAHAETMADPLSALDSGAVTVVPGFTGRLLEGLVANSPARSDAQVYRALLGALPEGIAAGDYATATEDKPALVVTETTARTWGSRDLAAVQQHCSGLGVGALTGSVIPNSVGSCRLSEARRFTDEKALFNALVKAEIVAGWVSTATPDVPDDLVILSDRKPALIRAENVVPLYRRNELDEMQLRAINEMAGVLDTASLVEMRRRIGQGDDPRSVADDFLATHPLGR